MRSWGGFVETLMICGLVVGCSCSSDDDDAADGGARDASAEFDASDASDASANEDAADGGDANDGNEASDARDGSRTLPPDPYFCWTHEPAPEGVSGFAVAGPNDVYLSTSLHVYHWNGEAMSQLPSPGSSVRGIWAAAPNDLWAAGLPLMRWNGTAWSEFSTTHVVKVTGRGPNDVWWATTNGHVYHFNGSQVRNTAPSGNPIAIDLIQSTLWEVAPNDVWHLGADPTRASGNQISHYDGSKWTVVSDPASPMMKDRSFDSIWGSGPNDIWAGVTKIVLMADRSYMFAGEVWHYDGKSWSIAVTPSAGLASTRVRSIWGTASDNVWAAVWSHHIPLSQLWNWNGFAWQAVDTGAADVRGVAGLNARDWWAYGLHAPRLGAPTGMALFHASGTCPNGSPDGGVADATTHDGAPDAGASDGFSWTQDVEYSRTPALRAFSPNDVVRAAGNGVDRWDGSTWRNVLRTEPLVATSLNPQTLWANSPTDIWAAGATVQHWDGQTWTDHSITSPSVFHESLWAAAANDVWTVVYGGGAPGERTLWHWNGQTWLQSPIPSGAQGKVQYVWGAAPDDVWVVARGGLSPSGGVFLHWNGAAWTEVQAESSVPLAQLEMTGLWGSGTNDVWATGQGYDDSTRRTVTWRFDGTAWKRVAGAPPAHCVFGSAASNVWFCGDGAQLHRYDGNAFSTIDIGVSSVTLSGGTAVDSEEIWVSGTYPQAVEVLFHGLRTGAR